MTPTEIRSTDSRIALRAGEEIFVRRWDGEFEGAGTRRPAVVLLHDSLGCVELWRDFPARLAARLQRPVLAYDRLGFGLSSPRFEPPSAQFIVEEGANLLPRLLDQLGIGEHVLFGHSVGGAMAVAAAARSARCRAVVTESAQAFVEERTLEGIRRARADFQEPAHFERLRRWHGEKARWVLSAWTETWLAPAFAGWNLATELAAVRCPLLALHGDRDEFGSARFPETIRGWAGGPAEAVLLTNCGHVPHREQPEIVLGHTARFLAAV